MDALSVEIKDLTKTYGQFKAVDGLKFNGAGKKYRHARAALKRQK